MRIRIKISILFFLLYCLGFAESEKWVITVNDSMDVNISAIDDPDFLFEYYRYQKDRDNVSEAMLAAYQYIFRFSEGVHAVSIEQEILDYWQQHSDNIVFIRQLNHFRHYFLPRLDADVQRDWLAHYYLEAGNLDSLRQLDQFYPSDNIRLYRIYGEAEAGNWEDVLVLIKTLPVEQEIILNAETVILDFLKNNSTSKFRLGYIFPGFSLYKNKIYSQGNRELISQLTMLGAVSYYGISIVGEPYLIIPYLLAAEIEILVRNRATAVRITAPDLRLLLPEKYLQKNENNLKSSLDNHF